MKPLRSTLVLAPLARQELNLRVRHPGLTSKFSERHVAIQPRRRTKRRRARQAEVVAAARPRVADARGMKASTRAEAEVPLRDCALDRLADESDVTAGAAVGDALAVGPRCAETLEMGWEGRNGRGGTGSRMEEARVGIAQAAERR